MVTRSTFQAGVESILSGDYAALLALLDVEPGLVHARNEGLEAASSLHYTTFDGLPELPCAAPKATPALARLLPQRGAEADAHAFGLPSAAPIVWVLSSWPAHAAGVQLELCAAYLAGGAAIDGAEGDGAPIGHAIWFGYRSALEYLARRGAVCDNLPAASALGDLERIESWFDGTGYDPSCMAFTQSEKTERGRFSWPPVRDADPMTLALVVACIHGRLDWVLGSCSAAPIPTGP